MNGTARAILACAIVCLSAATTTAQIHYQPTPPPAVTAENEAWYLAGEPVMLGGNIYYPTGPQVHFNGREMVRSGFFHAIPLYTLTTIEHYSKVFVPLSGGLMQPYERRRAGELAGTVGSTAPSFPVERSSEAAPGAGLQAAAPPSLIGRVDPAAPLSADTSGALGTTGEVAAAEPAAPLPRTEPRANEGIFVDFRGQRWYSAGAAAPIDRARLKRIGEHHDFPVYAAAGDPGAIYVPVSREADGFLARYSRRGPR